MVIIEYKCYYSAGSICYFAESKVNASHALAFNTHKEARDYLFNRNYKRLKINNHSFVDAGDPNNIFIKVHDPNVPSEFDYDLGILKEVVAIIRPLDVYNQKGDTNGME